MSETNPGIHIPNTIPRWKQVLLMMGSIIAINTIVTWGLIDFHGKLPHAGAVSRNEFERIIASTDHLSSEINNLRNDFRNLHDTMVLTHHRRHKE